MYVGKYRHAFMVWEISQQSDRLRVRLPVNLKGPLKGPDLFITQTVPTSRSEHLIYRLL